MTPTILPYPALSKDAAGGNWNLQRLDARFRSPLAGTVQDIIRSGYYWQTDLSWKTLSQQDKQRLSAWAAQMARGGNRCYLTNFGYSPLGSLAPAELISNGTNLSSTTGWTAQNSAALAFNNGQLLVANGTTSAGGASTPVTCVIGNSYVVRAVLTPGSTANAQLNIGTAPGGSTTQSNSYTAGGYIFTVFVATATTHYITLVTNTAVTGDYTLWSRIKCCLGATVNGGSQTGYSLAINGLPSGLSKPIFAGDLIQLATGQVVIATMDAKSTGSTSATISIEPALRSSPANASGVLTLTPEVPFMFRKQSSTMAFRPPRIGATSISLDEDISLG